MFKMKQEIVIREDTKKFLTELVEHIHLLLLDIVKHTIFWRE